MLARESREVLEHLQVENRSLRQTVAILTARVAALEQQCAAAVAERERLARLLLTESLNPHGQTSTFGADQVAALVEYLKQGR